jgi:hypothetical protein
LKCAVEFVSAYVLNVDLVNIYEGCSNEGRLMLYRVQHPSRKNEWARDLDKMKMSRQPGAVDPSAGVSVGCLPLCPWGLFLMVSLPSLITIPKCVSFEQPS